MKGGKIFDIGYFEIYPDIFTHVNCNKNVIINKDTIYKEGFNLINDDGDKIYIEYMERGIFRILLDENDVLIYSKHDIILDDIARLINKGWRVNECDTKPNTMTSSIRIY